MVLNYFDYRGDLSMFSKLTNPPKELESFAIVRFQDCDPFGHLNNARYIDYFMNARTDHLAQYYGFDWFGWGKQTGESWVVTKTQIAYLWPAGIMEEVLIRTRLIHADASALIVEGVMLDKAGKHHKSMGWVEFAYVNMQTGRTAQHSQELSKFFATVLVEGIAGVTTFDERIGEVKSEVRKRAAERAELAPAM